MIIPFFGIVTEGGYTECYKKAKENGKSLFVANGLSADLIEII